MGGQQFGCVLTACEFPERQVDIADGLCGLDAELMARCVGRHLPDKTADDGHRIATIRHAGTPLARGLRGGAVDDGNEVICDDDAVLAFLLGILRNEALLDDFHFGGMVY